MSNKCRVLNKLQHLVIALGVVFSLTLIIPYAIAVAAKRAPVIPYISDLGAHFPEAAIFSLGFFISALLTLTITVLQYLSVDEALPADSNASRFLNKASLGFGLIAVPGFVSIACFPFNSMTVVHFPAFALTWATVIAFQLMQTVLTKQTAPGTPVHKARIALTVLSIVFVVVFDITGGLGGGYRRNYGISLQSINPAFQWLASLMLFAYYLTFSRELRSAKLHLHLQVGPEKDPTPSSLKQQ